MGSYDGFDFGEDRHDVGSGDDRGAGVVGVDVDGVVAGLVEGLAIVIGHLAVQDSCVLEELDAGVDDGEDAFVGDLGCGEQPLGIGRFGFKT